MPRRGRVIGAGWYGLHLCLSLRKLGIDMELHEQAPLIFSGASGGNPARLHIGPHYPRSETTRAACRSHYAEFMKHYGHLTRHIPINIYAIADNDSQIDFGTYRRILKNEIEFITIEHPLEFGLRNVEGAILTGERHIVIDEARRFFEDELSDCIKFNRPAGDLNDNRWDFTVDATFCALDSENIDRYEPCITVLLEGPTEKAVTIMDGGFGSIYPWNESQSLSSLTSASLTPFSKTCRNWADARKILDGLSAGDINGRAQQMLDQIAFFWPEARDRYLIADERLSIRAMPRSGSDARLVDVIRVGERALRVRAGKIDAIFHAERLIREMINV